MKLSPKIKIFNKINREDKAIAKSEETKQKLKQAYHMGYRDALVWVMVSFYNNNSIIDKIVANKPLPNILTGKRIKPSIIPISKQEGIMIKPKDKFPVKIKRKRN